MLGFDDVDRSHHLHGDERHHRNECDKAEGIGHHIAAERFARAGRKRQHEGSRQRAGGDAAGVKRDGRERARHKKAQCERDQITGNEEIQDRDARDDAQHRKAARGGDRDRQAHAHRLGGDRACAQLLDLLVERMHRRLGVDDEPAHQHRKRGEQVDLPPLCQRRAERVAERREADIHAREEQHQTEVCIEDTDENAQKRELAQLERNDLKDEKEDEDRQQRHGHFP